jgi:hypothetical protein
VPAVLMGSWTEWGSTLISSGAEIARAVGPTQQSPDLGPGGGDGG